jgi:hypothetical protein
MPRRTTITAAMVLLAAAGVAAVVLSGSGPAEDDLAREAPEVDLSPEPAPCLGPALTVPTGRPIDVTLGRGPAPVGLASPAGAVIVLDLGASVQAGTLPTELAATIAPCPGTAPVVATGSLGELVVAATHASSDRRSLQLSASPVGDEHPEVRARSAGQAAAYLLAEWGAREVHVVLDDDVQAWVTLITDAAPDAVPLVVPVLPAEVAGTDEPESEPGQDAAEDAAAGDDPVRAALELLPADVRLTVVASDALAAVALSDRVLDAGREVSGTRVVSPHAGRAAAGVDGAESGALWLVDPADPLTALVVAAAAGARGDAVIAIDPSDAHEVLDVVDAIRTAAPELLLLVGPEAVDEVAVAWHLDAALGTGPLPWGGLLPLEGNRIVALYGSPGVPALGALGQQDLDATIARVRELAEPYAEDDLRVVPGFDVIATVASRSAEPQGDYSRRIPIATLRPLVDRAREEGMIVFLDLQPGRTDFLTQAKEYEELLREPHVSLALDPEWRLRPNEVHLRRIGSVEAAEVQTVVDWLAELVREERLPQKVLLLHQFTLSMLQDRDTIVIPPELVGVLHVDGQGELRRKEGTYRLMAQNSADHWQWGWKQFLRIDTPTVMEPARVIDRDPAPVVVTYQ